MFIVGQPPTPHFSHSLSRMIFGRCVPAIQGQYSAVTKIYDRIEFNRVTHCAIKPTTPLCDRAHAMRTQIHHIQRNGKSQLNQMAGMRRKERKQEKGWCRLLLCMLCVCVCVSVLIMPFTPRRISEIGFYSLFRCVASLQQQQQQHQEQE